MHCVGAAPTGVRDASGLGGGPAAACRISDDRKKKMT